MSLQPGSKDPRAVDALASHRATAGAAVASGDPQAIKRLYIDLGEQFYATHADNLDTIPVLSLAETHPVVVKEMEGVIGRILDAGCGPHPAVAIALGRAPDRTMTALDLGWGSVQLARLVAEREGVRLLGVVGDVEALPFRRSAFNGVVCDDTLEHLPDDRLGVAELARVAQPGGRVVLATPNRLNLYTVWRKVTDRLGGRRQPAPAYFLSNSHLREYTWAEFELLTRGGLRLVQRAPVGWSGSWKTRVMSRVIRLPGLHRFSQMIVLSTERR